MITLSAAAILASCKWFGVDRLDQHELGDALAKAIQAAIDASEGGAARRAETDSLCAANETLRSRIRTAESERDGYLRGMLTAAEMGGRLAQEIRKRMGDEDNV